MSGDARLAGVPLALVTRGPIVESVHAVAACAVDIRGNVLAALGTIDTPVFLRSTAKPFIAAAVVASNAAERFGLDERELAVMSASHAGETFHVEAVRSILRKIGLDESALQCGVHAPSSEAAAAALSAASERPGAVHHNCSGKHAGILAMCVAFGEPIANYLEERHPVQQRILAFCGALGDDDPASMPVGVDGCGIPVYATPLRRAALAFARFATLDGVDDRTAAALKRVRDAMTAWPAYVSGTGRFDSALISATRGNVVGKAGAEGVHGDALRHLGAGLALKVVDGAVRASSVSTMALMQHVEALSAEEGLALESFASTAVRNAAGREVGRVVADAGALRNSSSPSSV